MNRGFTLVELLVVVAIIGLLASIALASLNTARDQGRDAALKAQMGQLRLAAELYRSHNGDYGSEVSDGDCESGMFSNEEIPAIISQIQKNSPLLDCYVSESPTSWHAVATLNNPSDEDLPHFCVDHTGAATEINYSELTGGGGNPHTSCEEYGS